VVELVLGVTGLREALTMVPPIALAASELRVVREAALSSLTSPPSPTTKSPILIALTP